MWKLEGQFCIFTQKRKRKKEKKNKVLDFVKLEYYKEVLDFRNIEYHVFLIPQIPGQQCHSGDSPKNSSSLHSSAI